MEEILNVQVVIGDLGPYPAEVIKGQHWNGFECPAFDLATARKIRNDMLQQNVGLLRSGYELADLTDLVERRDADGRPMFVEIDYPGTRDEYQHPYRASDYCLYHIGAFGWCWERSDSDA